MLQYPCAALLSLSLITTAIAGSVPPSERAELFRDAKCDGPSGSRVTILDELVETLMNGAAVKDVSAFNWHPGPIIQTRAFDVKVDLVQTKDGTKSERVFHECRF